jgi:hypothetical protein
MYMSSFYLMLNKVVMTDKSDGNEPGETDLQVCRQRHSSPITEFNPKCKGVKAIFTKFIKFRSDYCLLFRPDSAQ